MLTTRPVMSLKELFRAETPRTLRDIALVSGSQIRNNLCMTDTLIYVNAEKLRVIAKTVNYGCATEKKTM